MHNAHPTIAFTQTLHAIEIGMRRYDLAENIPSPWQPIYCAAMGCAQRADIWADERTPLCGRHYLITVGDVDEVQP